MSTNHPEIAQTTDPGSSVPFWSADRCFAQLEWMICYYDKHGDNVKANELRETTSRLKSNFYSALEQTKA